MVVRAEKVVEIPASRERVWEFIDDSEKRARPISVVTDFELLDNGQAIWHVALPLPITDRTFKIETDERKRTPPEYVEFVGTSKAFRVVGEHELLETETGTELHNTFTVEGRLPGVETFFSRNIDSELDNLERAILDDVAEESE